MLVTMMPQLNPGLKGGFTIERMTMEFFKSSLAKTKKYLIT